MSQTPSSGDSGQSVALDLAERYDRLLALFPAERAGLGIDRADPDAAPADQPMTYGLVLSAEALRSRAAPTPSGARRVRLAARWLIDHSRLAPDGRPGWGLPCAWDHRPANTVYTITTAVALEGLLDALGLDLWSAAESAEALTLVRGVCGRWARELWVEGYSGGYFAYSPCDMAAPFFCINAPAVCLGALARLLAAHGPALPGDERRLLQSRADALAAAIVATAELREGAPFWEYIAQPNPLDSKRPNDLIHHAYILWGVETYREAGGSVPLPWAREPAIGSLDRFWKDGTLRFMAQDESTVSAARREEPANLWGAGMMLACVARWGSGRQARRSLEAILASYGPFPHLRVLPREVGGDGRFYPRDAAHVLLGLAGACFAREAAPGGLLPE